MEKHYKELELNKLLKIKDSSSTVDNLLSFLGTTPPACFGVSACNANLLHMAIDGDKSLEFIQKLCEHDVYGNGYGLASYLINEETTTGETPLIMAIKKQRHDLIQYFIFNEYCDLTKLDSFNQLPLSYGMRSLNTENGMAIFQDMLPYYSDDINPDGSCGKLSNELIELFLHSLINEDKMVLRMLLKFTHQSPLSNKGKHYFVNGLLSLPVLNDSDYCFYSETLPMFMAFLFHDEIKNLYNDFLFKIPTFVSPRNLRLFTPIKPLFSSFLLFLYYILVYDTKFYAEFLPELMSTGLIIGHIASPTNWRRFFQRIFYRGYSLPTVQYLVKQTTIQKLHEFILSFLPYDIEVNRILFINLQNAMQLSRRRPPTQIISQIKMLIDTLLPLSTYICLDHVFSGYLYEQITLQNTFTWFSVIHWSEFETIIEKYCSQKYHKYLYNKCRKILGVPTLKSLCRLSIRKACFMQEWQRCEYLKFRKIFELNYPQSLKEFLIFNNSITSLCN